MGWRTWRRGHWSNRRGWSPRASERSEQARLVVIGSTDGRNHDVDVVGALLRNREKPTFGVQSGAKSVHLPLF